MHAMRSSVVAAALCAGVTTSAAAQGGWRQWDIYLRDGTRVEANPLGAPDDAHVSTSVGGYERRGRAIPRARIDYIAAQRGVDADRVALPAGVTLPPPPTGRACSDVVVRRDGRRSTGHVTLRRVAYSEGVIVQRGAQIDLRDVAYVKFGVRCTR